MRLLLSDMPGFDRCCAHWGTKTDGIAIIMILLHNNYAGMHPTKVECIRVLVKISAIKGLSVVKFNKNRNYITHLILI